MLGGKSQLDKIVAEKNSAFKVLIATKNKLEASCKKAVAFIDTNLNEINKKEQEIIEKKDMNSALEGQIAHMKASIAETDRIVNPQGVTDEGHQDAGKDAEGESGDGQDGKAGESQASA